MKKGLLLIFALIISMGIFAQKKKRKSYEPNGYVVFENNDTLIGYIKIVDEIYMQQYAIFFKEGKKKYYRPGDIKTYHVEDRVYRREKNDFFEYFESEKITGSLFVSFFGKGKARFLAIETEDESYGVVYNFEFKKIAPLAFSDFPEIIEKIENDTYHKDDIREIFKEIRKIESDNN
jgi:hypothetical protein